MTHDFTVNGKFADQLIPTLLNWMKAQLRSRSKVTLARLPSTCQVRHLGLF